MLRPMRIRPFLLLLALAAAGCTSEREPPPQPAPRPQARPAPLPVPAPAPSPPPVGWADLPLTPGTWTWAQEGGDSTASFGPAGAPLFTLRCNAANRAVSFQRASAAGGGAMQIRTSFGARSLPMTPDAPFANATLSARDPFLDSVMFSRGRFSVEVAGAPPLILPSWAEVARVIEDCRR